MSPSREFWEASPKLLSGFTALVVIAILVWKDLIPSNVTELEAWLDTIGNFISGLVN